MKQEIPWYELSKDLKIEIISFVEKQDFHPKRKGVPYWILVLIDKGKRTLYADDRELRIGSGEFFLLPPYTSQKPLEQDEHTACFVHFYTKGQPIPAPEHIDACKIRLPMMGRLPETPDCFSHLCHLCKHLLNPHVDPAFITEQLLAVLSLISLHCQLHPQGMQKREVFHEACLTFIKDHVGVSLHAQDYETAFGLSYHQINQKFKEHYGYTVKQYHQRVRMKYAAQLLQTGMTVEETSRQCGYEDYYFFIRSFKKEYGISPGSYRSLHGMNT